MDSSWNETFLDAEARAYDSSDDSEDLDYVPSDASDTVSDDEDNSYTEVAPIQVKNTQLLRERMEGSLMEKVVKVLDGMEAPDESRLVYCNYTRSVMLIPL
jgi:uncharacterized protein related to proFAR isomerase